MPDHSNVLSTQEAADYLGAHIETIRRLARRGEIPAYKIGKDWRFRRDALLRWGETHYLRRWEPQVLVVDDDEMIRDILRRYLEPEGYRVTTAADGEAALRHVADTTPDVVLLDLQMPGMDGVEFLRRFREEHADIPVVVVTGYPDSEMMAQALKYTPLMMLPKPIVQTGLLDTVRLALGARQSTERRTKKE